MAEELNFTERDELKTWLQEQPVEWAQVIAARSASRILPNIGQIYQIKLNPDEQAELILLTFRACLISSAARKYPAEDMTALASASATIIWNTVSRDANWLVSHNGNAAEQAKELMQTPLWPNGLPQWIDAELTNLTTNLLEHSAYHQVWIDWYNNVLNGEPFFGLSPAREKALTLKIVYQDEIFGSRTLPKSAKEFLNG